MELNAFSGATQRSLDWFRSRLGNFTGSEVGKLMKSGRKKEDMFGETAMTYISEVAFERDLNPKIVEDDELFQIYVDETSINSRSLRWGIEQEENARNLFEKIMGVKVEKCPSVNHPTIERFSSSPDGYVVGDEERACLEIKCLGKSNYAKYMVKLHTPEDLKDLNDQYYWQCVAHMSVTGAHCCYFFAYNPFCNHSYIIVKIPRNEEEIEMLESRVITANGMVKQILGVSE